MERRPKIILFDLGGVVVRWVGIKALSELTGLSTARVGDLFKKSKTGNAFEKGLCSNSEFIAEFRNVFDLSGTDEELILLWNSWVQAPYPDIIPAIQTLKQSYRVACLSNTNDLHWRHLKTYLDLPVLFDPPLASHEINRAKPDPGCYAFVIETLNVPSSDILFLDDTAVNVAAAQQSGMQAHLVDPEFGAVPTLKALGLI